MGSKDRSKCCHPPLPCFPAPVLPIPIPTLLGSFATSPPSLGRDRKETVYPMIKFLSEAMQPGTSSQALPLPLKRSQPCPSLAKESFSLCHWSITAEKSGGGSLTRQASQQKGGAAASLLWQPHTSAGTTSESIFSGAIWSSLWFPLELSVVLTFGPAENPESLEDLLT